MTGTAAQTVNAQQQLSAVQLAVTGRVYELMYANLPANGFDYHAATFKEVQEYSEPILRNIALALQPGSEMATGIAQQITNTHSEYIINNTIHFHQKTEATDYLRTIADVSALSYYAAGNVRVDLTLADEHVQQQCIALIKFAKLIDTLPEEPSPFLDYIDDLNYDIRVINDELLVALIAHRPDDIERIAETVLHHRTSNAAAINGIMEGAFAPVAEGYL